MESPILRRPKKSPCDEVVLENTHHHAIKLNHHNVTYPQVIKMTEESMLIVKETLSKRRELANSAHNEAFSLLVKKMEKELAVPPPKDPELFLRTLLKGYIILTR